MYRECDLRPYPQDVSQIREPRDNIIRLRSDLNGAKEFIGAHVDPFKPLQIFFEQPIQGLLMEWDLNDMLLQSRITNFKIAGYRDKGSTAFANWMCVQTDSLRIYWTIICRLARIKCNTSIWIVTGNYLKFPHGYSWQPLQYSCGLSRVPYQHLSTTMNEQWFIYPKMFYEESKYFSFPGCALTPNAVPNIFYRYQPFDSLYVPIPKSSIRSVTSRNAKEYRRLQYMKTQMYLTLFPALQDYQNEPNVNPSLMEQAQKIRCPQEARILLQYGIKTRWFHLDISRNNI